MNYWILQSNPCTFALLDYYERYEGLKFDDWHIGQYWKEIQPEDIAFIWKSNDRRERNRGIYATAKIRTVPFLPEQYGLVAEFREIIDEIDSRKDYWLDEGEKARMLKQPRVLLEYTRLFLHKPLLASELRAVPNLKDLLILKMWRRGIYKLTEDQGRTIEEMIESR